MSTAAIVTIIVAFIISIPIAIAIVKSVNNERYRQLESEVLNHLGYQSWEVARFYDDEIYVKSRRTLDAYDQVRYIKDNVLHFKWWYGEKNICYSNNGGNHCQFN